MRSVLLVGFCFAAILLFDGGTSGTVSAAATAPFVRSSQSALTVGARRRPLSARAVAVNVGSSPVCASNANESGQYNSDGSGSCGAIRANIAPIGAPHAPLASLAGLSPDDLLSAYGLGRTSWFGYGQTVAVVVAYHNAALEYDLGVYRSEFGLGACTSASGCLRFVSTKNAKPSGDASWAVEADIDVQMVSAICPRCRILVSEAKSTNISDLAAAVDTAVAAGATVVSNSYALPENKGNDKYARSYDHPGIPITAGAGDLGYGVAFPASLPSVVAVGGTTLSVGSFGAVRQTAWTMSGSGCSTYEPKPSWQRDRGCANRTVNDVAVVADPATGVDVYSSPLGGWNVLGGTSVGAPIVAAMYALAGNGRFASSPGALYARPFGFHPLAGGANGRCAIAYFCTVATGYNGPGGLGTPYGLSAF